MARRPVAGPLGQRAAKAADATAQAGFADSQVDGEALARVRRKGSDVRIVVGRLQSVRREIVLASLTSILKPMLWALPLLALGIWWAVRGSVQPLGRLGNAVAARQPLVGSNPCPPLGVPPEVLPLVTALNELFERMARLLATEQQFTADAARAAHPHSPASACRPRWRKAPPMHQSAPRRCKPRCRAATGPPGWWNNCCSWPGSTPKPPPTAGAARRWPMWRGRWPPICRPPQSLKRQRIILREPWPGVQMPLPEPLARVLLRNLLDNALRYSPEVPRCSCR